MTYRKTLEEPVAQAPGILAWHDTLQNWFNAKNKVTAQLEDSQFGGEVGGSWSTALQNAINEIEQTEPGIMGGQIQVYPDQHRLNSTVTLTGKKSIGIVGAGGPSHIDGGAGFGASFYAGTSGMTMIQHAATSGLNHWGPYFEGINFVSNLFQNTTLVDLQSVNHWKFRRCSFNYGGTQLKVDGRLDLGAGGDASYGHLDDVTFSHYTNYGLYIVSGQCKAHDLKWFEGVSGSWAIRLDGQVANATFLGLKLDTLANGVWCKGYANVFYGLHCEGSAIGLRLDKDAAVGFSGHDNEVYNLHTTFRGAGEVGVDVTTAVSGYNAIHGYYWQGTGAATITDPNGKLLVSGLNDGSGDILGGAILKLPNRNADPPTPTNGAVFYAKAGRAWVKGTDGVARQIT